MLPLAPETSRISAANAALKPASLESSRGGSTAYTRNVFACIAPIIASQRA